MSKEKVDVLKKVKEFEKSPWAFLVRKSKVTILLIISLLLFGSVTVKNLPKELNPEVEIPIAVVSTVFPGASPLDVEEQVTKEIEDKISDLTGIKKIESNSSVGVSSVVVEFEAGEDLDDSMDELKDKVDEVKPDLPEDATDPRVMEISIDEEPVIEAVIASDNYDLADLKRYAENIKDEIKGLPYVSEVNVVGGRDAVISIDLDQTRLLNYGFSAQQVIGVLASNNVNFPIGSIEVGSSRYNIRVESKFKTVSEIAETLIGKTSDGKPVYLEDVANVKEGFSKETGRSRLSSHGENPVSAISIQMYKKAGGDITKLAQDARNRIVDGAGSLYPEGVKVEIVNDMSVYVSESIDNLTKNGMATVLLILVLLFFFLGWKEALLAGPAIPFSFFIAFIIMSVVGESLNNISLFSLVLSLGLLVDSAIVIVEGMYNKVAKYKLSGYEAAISTIREYALPLLSGMLTTVAAFFPLLFVKGIFGQFMKSIPTVVIATLFAGLFVSVSIIPAIGVYLIKPVTANGRNEKKNRSCPLGNFISRRIAKLRNLCRDKGIKSKPREERFLNMIFAKLTKRYREFIPKVLGNKRTRRMVIFGAWTLFFASMALPITGILKVQSFGSEDSEFFYVNLEMPQGTVLDGTDQVSQKIEKVLLEEPEVINFASNVGASMGSSGAGNSHRAFFRVNLRDKDEREVKSMDVVESVKEKISQNVTEGRVTYMEAESGPPAGKPIEVKLFGNDLIKLEQLAEKIKAKIQAIEDADDVQTSIKNSAGELVFVPNKTIIAERGLSVIQISAELRTLVSGDDSIEINKNGEEVDFDLRLSEERLKSIEDVKDLAVVNQRGEKYYLTELGELKFMPALASIKRIDNERVVTITGDIVKGGNATEVNKVLKAELVKMSFPAGYRTSFGGEAQELQEVYVDMLLKMFLGIILILFILVLQFNSYKQTLIILFTIPLAMIGVFWGMAAGRMQLDIPAFIGIVSLVGIVVNNAIILIDQINREIRSGKELIPAIQDAGAVRMRPIFLTTITTIVGLLPLSITQPIWRNLGFSIIFGLAFSTLLTLIIIPVMFVSLRGKSKKGKS